MDMKTAKDGRKELVVTTIRLDPLQVEGLRVLSERRHVERSVLVREGIDLLLARAGLFGDVTTETAA